MTNASVSTTTIPSSRSGRHPAPLPLWLALFAAVLATALIVRSYSAFYQTSDEPAHIACGMQWLDRGTYLYEALHPPLARVATAVLPYLHGSRDLGLQDLQEEGNAILERGGYETTLRLARMGILPFFWLTCFLVWRFMSSRFDRWHAAAAVAMLALCPVVLGHSGLATTDAPVMAVYLGTLMALLRLLEAPGWDSALACGVVAGLAVGTKFTAMPFLIAGGGLLVLFLWIERRRFPLHPGFAVVVALAAVLRANHFDGYASASPACDDGRLGARAPDNPGNAPRLSRVEAPVRGLWDALARHSGAR